MNQVLVLSLLLPYYYLAPWWVIRRDMRRLPATKLARAWNSASLGSAILVCGPFCIPIHFIKVHGWLKGAPVGLLWSVGTLLLPDLILSAIQSLLA